MTTCLAVAALAFIAAVLGTVVVRRLALRLGVVDRPDGYRKIHQREMPRLGGVAIYVAFALPLVALWCIPTTGLAPLVRRHAAELLGLLAGSAVALAAGIVDDVRGLSPRWKLLAQAVAASIVIAAGLSLDTISNPFGGTIRLGLLGYPITLLWLVGCMNAVNLVVALGWGLAGVATGTTIVWVLYSFFFWTPLVARLLRVRLRRYFLRGTVVPLANCIPAAATFALLRVCGLGRGWLGLLAVLAIAAAVQGAHMLPWGLASKDQEVVLASLRAAFRWARHWPPGASS